MSYLVLQPAQVPADAPLPSSLQQIVNSAAAYLKISGASELQGVVISATEPAVADRDKLWVKRDPLSNRVIGLFTFTGYWTPVPTIIPQYSDSSKPTSPKKGELIYNTTYNCLQLFDVNGVWTTNLYHKGSTDNRPVKPVLGYIYFDTDINRELRFTDQGWTTVDGFVGEIRMCADISEDTAKTRNPGWTVYEGLANRFPMGRSDIEGNELNSTGGSNDLLFQISREKVDRGNPSQSVVDNISLQGKAGGDATADANDNWTTYTLDNRPAYRGVLYLRKAY